MMTLGEIKNMVMFQTNNDADDLGDYLPYIGVYVDEGYDLLANAFAGEHVSQDSETFTPLRHDKSTPNLPEWAHKAIADWATWQIYRNGNVQKQNRGYQYRAAFERVEARLRSMTASEKNLEDSTADRRRIINIPK